MTKNNSSQAGSGERAQRKALMKPFEVLAISIGMGLFAALLVIFTLKNVVAALVLGGGVVVLALVVIGLLLLGYKPNPDVPVYLDRDLYESGEPGAQQAALKVDPDALGQELPREEPDTPDN
ncbi:hypothetical protein [uncultured Gulosibacter sp.]|uniref:hypothetical protein n=1 Tax=uncultured Gulosibacter sp. TaxID=1339167 RepID=UPI00288B2B40|nr:hypothetical protein [uncultured Gulosibacter sp.]